MSGIIQRFRIEALHNVRTIDVPIHDNKLVLVGENGTGKSTVSNFIYYLLTRQWHRMLEYEFKNVLAIIDDQEILINRDDLVDVTESIRNIRRYIDVSPSVRRQIESIIRRFSIDELLHDPEGVRRIAREFEIPPTFLMEYISQLTRGEFPLTDKIREVEQILKSSLNAQVLYLPTYRRIEQDIRSIFPGLEDARDMRERLKRRVGNTHYVELVEFGMEDVEGTINRKMGEIKENVRNGLNNLTGTYLRDVIQGAYRSADLPSKLKELDENAINAIFSRIPSAILSEDEQKKLREIVNKVQNIGRIDDEDKVVAHFLTQLVDLYKTQQDDEREVREFVRVCNGYLSGKQIVFNNLTFEIFILQQTHNADTQRISLKMLSSGEKQIVSLFSQIYLSGGMRYFVIIDEPELSLSVPWQKRFLPNILESNHCDGLIAVTHSPFIYDNQLDKYVHSLEEFVEGVNVVP